MVLQPSCFEIKIGAYTAKFTNVRIAGFGWGRYLIRQSEMFVKDKTQVTSRVSGIESTFLYFGQLLFESDEEKFSFRSVECQEICSHPGGEEMCCKALRR